MKFLIAASLVCLALFGQTQAGSLRGYTHSVPVPHSTYGVPSSQAPDAVVEQAAPIVVPEVQNALSADSLPLIESAANFGTSSKPELPAVTPAAVVPITTPQPELPLLPPGLPALPELPVVPLNIENPVAEVHNTYLPPVKTVSETPIDDSLLVSGVPDVPAIPEIAEIPNLPAAPFVPVVPQGSDSYDAPAVSSESNVASSALPVTPLVPVEVHPTPSAIYGPPTVTNEVPPGPKITEIPALPAASVIPKEPVQVYEGPKQPAAPATPIVPMTATPTPNVIYGAPAVVNEVPQIAQIPALPPTPVVPSAPVHLYEIPAVHQNPSAVYGAPVTTVNEVSSLPQVSETPAFPATVQVYEFPAPHTTPSVPLLSTAVYGAPTVLNGVQFVGIPALPEAPKVPSVTLVEQSGPTVPTASTHTFSIRPIVSQIVNFANSFLPAGSGSFVDSLSVQVPEAAPAEVPTREGYHYEKPGQAFPASVSNAELGAASVSANLPEVVQPSVEVPAIPVNQPNEVPAKTPEKAGSAASGYHYDKPTSGFPTPLSVGFVSHVQNSASSLSSSSIQVNHVNLPSTGSSSGSADSVVIEPSTPSGTGFTIQSLFGSSQETGNFSQVSVINHGQPNASPIPGFIGVTVPHNVYAVPSF